MSSDNPAARDATIPTDPNGEPGTGATTMRAADVIAATQPGMAGQPSAASDPATTAEGVETDVAGDAVAAAGADTTASATDAPPATATATATDAATATATTTDPTTTEAVSAAPAVATKPVRTAGAVALVVGKRLLRFAFTLALLGLGVYAGWQFYETNRPAPTVVGDPAVLGVATPPAVAELATAIGSDDANGIRVALSSEMFSSYTADMERFGIMKVEGVATLGTYMDGPRSATALAILGRTADGSPFTINLVVIAQDGQIVRLR